MVFANPTDDALRAFERHCSIERDAEFFLNLLQEREHFERIHSQFVPRLAEVAITSDFFGHKLDDFCVGGHFTGTLLESTRLARFPPTKNSWYGFRSKLTAWSDSGTSEIDWITAGIPDRDFSMFSMDHSFAGRRRPFWKFGMGSVGVTSRKSPRPKSKRMK